MAFRCALVMRGGRKPCVVDFNSSMDDASGVVVPIPALPLEGNVFCACNVHAQKQTNKIVYIFFIQKNL